MTTNLEKACRELAEFDEENRIRVERDNDFKRRIDELKSDGAKLALKRLINRQDNIDDYNFADILEDAIELGEEV